MSDTEEANEKSSLLQRIRRGSKSVPRGDFSDRKRWWSIRVMYLTMFLSSVTFTLTISSIWPFLRVLDHTATADFLGWVVSAYSMGQLIASPLFGMWANWRGRSREPLVLSITLGVGANMMYAYLQSFEGNKGVLMIVARGLIGFAAGNVAVVRSYVAGATTLKERTAAMANVSIFQSIGFILGPVIQAAFVPMSYPGVIEAKGLHLNMYTAPAILGAILCFINVVLIFVVFEEFRVPGEVSVVNVQSSYEQSVDEYKPDYFAVISCIFIFFVVLFIFTIFETIATPLSMDMFAWTKQESTLYIGVLLASCGVEAIGVFIVLKMLSRRFNERYLLIGGFVLCFAGYFVQLPWGDGKLILAQSADSMSGNITTPVILQNTHVWKVNYDPLFNSELYVDNQQSDDAVGGLVGNVGGTLATNNGNTSRKTISVSNKLKINSNVITAKIVTSMDTASAMTPHKTTMEPKRSSISKTITTLKTPITAARISTAEITTITDAVIHTAETMTSPITDDILSTAGTFITDDMISTAKTVETPTSPITDDILSTAGTFITDDMISTAKTIETPTSPITDDILSTAGTFITDDMISTAKTIETPTSPITDDILSTAGTFITDDMISTAKTIETPTSPITDDILSTAGTFITDDMISTAKTIETPTSPITDDILSTAGTFITDDMISTAKTIETPTPTITDDVLSSAGTFITEDVLSSVETVPTTVKTITDVTVASAQTLSTSQHLTTEAILSTFATNSTTTDEPVGCPSTIPWCYFTPPVYLAQFIMGCVIISAGYPTANVMSYTLFSKILGPKPQGLWMGWLTASGSLARTLGPIFVSQIYYSSGPRVVFAVVCGIVLATIIAILAVFRKLVPCKYTADYQAPPNS